METKLIYIVKRKKQKKQYVSMHTHEYSETVLYLGGRGRTEIGGKSYDFSDGSVAVMAPGEPHDEYHEEEGTVLYFAFEFDFFELKSGVYRLANFAEISRLAHKLYLESRAPRFASQLFSASLINELTVLFMRDIMQKTDNDWAERFDDGCLDGIDVKRFAQSRGYSYDGFRRKFKRLYGMSPQSYILHSRLSKAGDMLSKTELSCTEIAFRCGFNDSAQFSRMFKKQFGTSPREFRENFR